MNNNLTIYYCDSCAKSYGNVYKGNLKMQNSREGTLVDGIVVWKNVRSVEEWS